MLTVEQIAQLRDLLAEGKRLTESGDTQGSAAVQQQIEALKAQWRAQAEQTP